MNSELFWPDLPDLTWPVLSSALLFLFSFAFAFTITIAWFYQLLERSKGIGETFDKWGQHDREFIYNEWIVNETFIFAFKWWAEPSRVAFLKEIFHYKSQIERDRDRNPYTLHFTLLKNTFKL